MRKTLVHWPFLLFFSLLLNACLEDNSSQKPAANSTQVAGPISVVPAAVTQKQPVPELASSPTPLTQPSGKPASEVTTQAELPFSVQITFDQTAVGKPISPYIYGLAGTDEKDPNYASNLHPGLMRWGGNPNTRFNWVLGNAWNAGRDWEFRNVNYAQGISDVASAFIQGANDAGAATLLTIPTIGWVAKNTDNATQSKNVPPHGGPPVSPGSEAIKGYDPSANRELTSVKSQARKNGPFVTKPDPHSPVIYQDEWVASLLSRYGPASGKGVKFYAMDNEPELWSELHTDVHPVRMGYDDLLANFEEYASAVKAVDPSALITGPATAGWTGYMYAELDRGDDNFKSIPDRKRHGNLPFLAWFLDGLRRYQEQTGKRLLDVLDVHYYPQAEGVFDGQGGKTDAASNALRLRSTRSLWDDNYKDESWIDTKVRLIPRLREWIDTYYPGTKIGINEWNWGSDKTINGALAIGTVLGIFGREGVYTASYWMYPPKDSPGYYAFKAYTNFDGKGGTFGDTSIPLKISDDQKISAFAALDRKSGRLRLILINNQPDREQNVSLNLARSLPTQSANVYQLSPQTGAKLQNQDLLSFSQTSKLSFTLPSASLTLIDLQL